MKLLLSMLVALVAALVVLGTRGDVGTSVEAVAPEADPELQRATERAVLPGPSLAEGAARREVEVAAPEPPPEPAPTGAIELRFVDGNGLPVPGGEWRVVESKDPPSLMSEYDRQALSRQRGPTAVADETGLTRFDGLEAGTWALAPVAFDAGTAPSLPAQAADLVFEVADGETTHREIVLERAVTLLGQVRRADGATDVALVRATCWDGGRNHPLRTYDAQTEASGTFVLYVRSGTVRIESWPLGDGALKDVVRAETVTVELAAGAVHHLDLVYGAGAAVARGRVVDQDDVPWEGLRAKLMSVTLDDVDEVESIRSRIGSALVDADGVFEFRGLQAGSYEVSFEHPSSDFPTQGGIGEYPLPATFRCADSGTVDVGTSLVYRWANVHVEGQVFRTDGRSPGGGRLRILIPPWNRITWSRPGKPLERTVRIDADGRFTFDYSAHIPGELTYVLGAGATERRTVVPFEAGARDVETVTLTYP